MNRQMTRAWVLQERLFAPRTVHFASSEMFWECNSISFQCECGTEQDGNRSFRPSISDDTLEYWYTAVERFSEMDLTQASDKLPAISGIASAVESRLGSLYLAGLWYSELPQCLLWSVNLSTQGPHRADVIDPSSLYRSHKYRAPTWAWPSVEYENDPEGRYSYGINCWQCYTSDSMMPAFMQDRRFQVLKAETVVLGKNSFGQVTRGVLRVKGRFLIAKSVVDLPEVPGHTHLRLRYGLIFERPSENVRLMADVFFKTDQYESQTMEDEKLHCVLIGALRGRALGIVLRRSIASPSQYERVGLMEFGKDHGWIFGSRALSKAEGTCNALIEALYGDAKIQVFDVI